MKVKGQLKVKSTQRKDYKTSDKSRKVLFEESFDLPK